MLLTRSIFFGHLGDSFGGCLSLDQNASPCVFGVKIHAWDGSTGIGCQRLFFLVPDDCWAQPGPPGGTRSTDASPPVTTLKRLVMVIWAFYQCPSLPCGLLLDLAATGGTRLGEA